MSVDSNKIAKVIFIDGDGKILLLLRGLQSKDPFTLDLPGGHIHEDEEPSQGAIREVEEETNLIIQEEDLKFLEQVGRTTYYKVLEWKGNIFPPSQLTEHESYLWVSANNIKYLKGVIVPERHYGILTGLRNNK
tara:strand:- start:623 stop:1024 length:402 start_codon:yes stop_codon:yes gene_type:complete